MKLREPLCLMIAAAVAVVIAIPTHATDLAGRDVLIPIVGRTAGAFGTMWQTDVVITNLDTRSESSPITISFVTAGQAKAITATLSPRQSLILADVVKKSFGLESATGYLRVAGSANARISARARVYNRGSAAGEFGQAVPGLPVDALMREHYLPGLSATGGNRSNVGVANPWAIDVPVSFEFIDQTGESHGSFQTSIAAQSVRQINDIFYEFSMPPSEGAMVRVVAAVPVYAYASVVRNDTGDAVFIQGTGLAVGNEFLVAPACSNPAPVALAPVGSRPANGWIVVLSSDADADATTDMLAKRHGFTAHYVYSAAFKGFAAELTGQQVAAIRCEPVVQFIQENASVVP